MVRDFPLVTAWKLSGREWTLVFVGTLKSRMEIQRIFFAEGVEAQRIGGIELWRLSTASASWLSEGADLVICELSRNHPLRPRAPVSFTVPTWITQVVTYPETLPTLLAGKRKREIRTRINRFHKAGFSWRFSRAEADFELFYHRMYRPFVSARHGDRAWITPYPELRKLWLSDPRGGLVLVMRDGQAVAGGTCYLRGQTCYGLDMGVLDADATLIRQGIMPFLFWCTGEWGHRQGARFYNLGESRGWRSDGPFRTKSSWGARVTRWQGTYRTLTVLADNLRPAVRERLNQIGFVCEFKGLLCGIVVEGKTAPLSHADLRVEVGVAKDQGLDGVVLVSPNARRAVF